jgi:hypothetical protein
MRRKDREVTDLSELEQIIKNCDVCRLGLSDNNVPYIVPLNFGYEFSGDQLTLYFHCAKEGRKLDILKENPNVCFEMDCGHELVQGEAACSCTMKYESVIGIGKIEFIHNMQDKKFALSKLMGKYSEKTSFNFEESMLNRVAVLKVTTSNFTGKRQG